jgi:hypothetical protein
MFGTRTSMFERTFIVPIESNWQSHSEELKRDGAPNGEFMKSLELGLAVIGKSFLRESAAIRGKLYLSALSCHEDKVIFRGVERNPVPIFLSVLL